MHLQVLQEKLSKATSTALRFTSTKAQLPILANLLFKTQKNKLIVNATNLELSISIAVGAQITKEGEIAVPAKVVSDIINNLPKQSIELEVEKEQLKILTEGFSGTVSAMNSSDFPGVPLALSKNSFEIPTKEFTDSLSKLLFAVSTDEARPTICGVLFIFKKGELELVATDGFRLSRKTVVVKDLPESGRVIIPKAILSEVVRLSGAGESISLSYLKEDNQVVFGVSDVVVSSRTIEGDFPPFEKIIPKSSEFKVEVGKEELLRGVKLASPFAREAANVLALGFKGGGVEVSAESKVVGNQKSTVDARIDGDIPKGLKIAFNYRFMEEAINAIEGESVGMEFIGANNPGVFRDPGDKDYLHLIMPVKVQD